MVPDESQGYAREGGAAGLQDWEEALALRVRGRDKHVASVGEERWGQTKREWLGFSANSVSPL